MNCTQADRQQMRQQMGVRKWQFFTSCLWLEVVDPSCRFLTHTFGTLGSSHTFAAIISFAYILISHILICVSSYSLYLDQLDVVVIFIDQIPVAISDMENREEEILIVKYLMRETRIYYYTEMTERFCATSEIQIGGTNRRCGRSNGRSCVGTYWPKLSSMRWETDR